MDYFLSFKIDNYTTVQIFFIPYIYMDCFLSF
jgi:hypothetical protein